MSEDLKALDVLHSYIDDHNGDTPINPNKLVGYSCEQVDLPTLDYFQARSIMGTYQNNVAIDKLRSQQKKSNYKNKHHSKSKYKPRKKKRHPYHSSSTKKDSNNQNRKHHHTYQTQYKQQKQQHYTADSSDSDQTQDSTSKSSSSSSIHQHKYTYASPKQSKYHKKNRKQSPKIHQQNKQRYSSSGTESISSSDYTEHQSFKKTNIKPNRRNVEYNNPTQQHHIDKDRRKHYQPKNKSNKSNKSRSKQIGDNRNIHVYKRQQQHSHHSQQRIPTESYNRNINYKKPKRIQKTHIQYNTDKHLHRNKQRSDCNNKDRNRYERPSKMRYDNTNNRMRGDFPQHSGYSIRTRRNDRYNKKEIELETPRYEQTSGDDSFDSDISTESSLHSSTISSTSTLERDKKKKKKGKIVRRQRVKHTNNNERYTATRNAEIELEIIPPKIIKKTRNSARNDGEKYDVPKQRTLKRKRENKFTKTSRDENESKVKKTVKSTELDDQTHQRTDDNDNMAMDNKCKIMLCIILGSICCFGVILSVILVPLSIKRVGFNESAIRYNDLTKQTDDETYTEGRYILTPQTKLFTYDTIIQKLSLELDCLTSDGILMGINVSIQYSIAQNNIYNIWNDYGREGNLEFYFTLIAADSIRDSVGSFTAGSFYQNRYKIQNTIENGLFDAIKDGHTYINMTAAILSGYAFPELLKETIRMKRNAENDIELAKNERNGNITDAETKLLISKIYAKQLEIQAQAEKESILAEAYAKGRVIMKEFEYRKQLMTNAITNFNMTANEFVKGWLSAFVLLHAHQPYTTTLVKNGNKSRLMLGMKF